MSQGGGGIRGPPPPLSIPKQQIVPQDEMIPEDIIMFSGRDDLEEAKFDSATGKQQYKNMGFSENQQTKGNSRIENYKTLSLIQEPLLANNGVTPQKIIISSASKPKLASTDKKLDRLRRGPHDEAKNSNEGYIVGTGGENGTINNSLHLNPQSLDMTGNNNETTMVSKTTSGGVIGIQQDLTFPMKKSVDMSNSKKSSAILLDQRGHAGMGIGSRIESALLNNEPNTQTEFISESPQKPFLELQKPSIFKPNFQMSSSQSVKNGRNNSSGVGFQEQKSIKSVQKADYPPTLNLREQNLELNHMDTFEKDLNKLLANRDQTENETQNDNKQLAQPQNIQVEKPVKTTSDIHQMLYKNNTKTSEVINQTPTESDKEKDKARHYDNSQLRIETIDGAPLFERGNADMISPIYSRNGSNINAKSFISSSIKKGSDIKPNLNESQMTIQNKKPIIIPQKSIQMIKPNISKLDLSTTQHASSRPDPSQAQLIQIETLFTSLRGSILAFTFEYDESQLLSQMKHEIANLEQNIKFQDEEFSKLSQQVTDNQKVLADYNCLSSTGKVTFLQEEHQIRLERRQIDARLKNEQVEAGQNKIDELDLKLQSLEDQNYQLRVKSHMKKTDYEQYQDILKPYFNGADVDVDSLDRMKKEQKHIENRYRDTMLQIQSLQKRGNYDLKVNRKRMTDEQIRIELEMSQKQSHLDQTLSKLKVQNNEIQQLKDLYKNHMAKKNGKLTAFEKMESPKREISNTSFHEALNQMSGQVTIEPLALPLGLMEQKRIKKYQNKDPSPRMLAANNPPAINVTQLKSNSEVDGDGQSRASFSNRGGEKKKNLPSLKMDRSSSKIEHQRNDGEMSLLSPIVKSKRSASNHHRMKTMQKNSFGNDLLAIDQKHKEGSTSFRSAISLRSNNKKSSSNSGQSGKKLNESQALSRSIRRRRVAKGSVIGKLQNFHDDDDNKQTSEDLEEIYNILDVGLSAQGLSDKYGGSHGHQKKMLPPISSPNQQDSQQNGSSSFMMGTVNSHNQESPNTIQQSIGSHANTPQGGNLLLQPIFNLNSGGQYRAKTDSSTTFKTQTIDQERSPMIEGSIPNSYQQNQTLGQLTTQTQPRIAPLSLNLQSQVQPSSNDIKMLKQSGYPGAIKEEESKLNDEEDDEEIDNFEDMFGRASPASRNGGIMNLENLIPQKRQVPLEANKPQAIGDFHQQMIKTQLNNNNRIETQKGTAPALKQPLVQTSFGGRSIGTLNEAELKFKENAKYFIQDDDLISN